MITSFVSGVRPGGNNDSCVIDILGCTVYCPRLFCGAKQDDACGKRLQCAVAGASHRDVRRAIALCRCPDVAGVSVGLWRLDVCLLPLAARCVHAHCDYDRWRSRTRVHMHVNTCTAHSRKLSPGRCRELATAKTAMDRSGVTCRRSLAR